MSQRDIYRKMMPKSFEIITLRSDCLTSQSPSNLIIPSQSSSDCCSVTTEWTSTKSAYRAMQSGHATEPGGSISADSALTFNEEPISSKIPGQAEIKTSAKNAHRCTGLSTAHEVRRCPNINGASMPIIYGMEGSQFHRIWALLFIQDE